MLQAFFPGLKRKDEVTVPKYHKYKNQRWNQQFDDDQD